MRIYRPGERKRRKGGKIYANKTCIARFTHEGEEFEIRTDTTDPKDAERYAYRFIEGIEQGGSDAGPTFGDVADEYLAAEVRSSSTWTFVQHLKNAKWRERHKRRSVMVRLRDIPIDDVRQAHLYRAANVLYPTALPQTKNRQAIRVGAAILHFAHYQDPDQCAYRPIKLLEENQPETETATDADMKLLLSAKARRLDERVWRTNLFLFCQGSRITETLRLDWDRGDVRLDEQELRYWVAKGKSKGRREKLVAMHPLIFEVLANSDNKTGKVLGFRDRHEFYDALDLVCKKLGTHVRPHMIRRWFGTTIGKRYENEKALVDAGTWTSQKGARPYVKTGLEEGRETLKSLPIRANFRGKIAK